MKILVTGIAGFLGSHIADLFIKEGHNVIGCDNLSGGETANVPDGAEFFLYDCTDMAKMRKLTRGVDVVFHAASTPTEGLSSFSPARVSMDNYQASATVFSAAIAHDVRRIVYFSSMARYGIGAPPFTEDQQPAPVDPYGISKYAGELLLRNLCGTHATEYVILVPHNIIGPRQKFNDPFRNVVSIMANMMIQKRQPIIYGDGEQRRCFSHVQDCLQVVGRLLDADVSGQVFNIGPDEEFITINELAKLIARLTEFQDLTPVYVPDRPREVKEAVCSSGKIRQVFGYKTEWSLERAVRSTVRHILTVGPRKFRYHLDLEIINNKTPKTWKDRLF